MKKIKQTKKFILIFTLFILSSCLGKGNYTKKGQQESWNKFIQSNSSDSWIVIEQGEWKYEKWGGGYIWNRDHDTFNYETNITSSTSMALDHTKKSYECIEKYGKDRLMYAGKWQYVPKIGKNIRLIACGFLIQYESMDEKNKLIKEKPLKLYRPISKNAFSRDRKTLAIIKFHDKHGYNAYFDLKTGEIKQAKE